MISPGNTPAGSAAVHLCVPAGAFYLLYVHVKEDLYREIRKVHCCNLKHKNSLLSCITWLFIKCQARSLKGRTGHQWSTGQLWKM